MKVSEVLACSFERWYPKFSGITVQSFVIEIPKEVVDFLAQHDSVYIPIECLAEMKTKVPKEEDDWDDDKSENEDEKYLDDVANANENDEEEDKLISFPAFTEKIRETLNNNVLAGDGAFVKLNWSSPRDARWVAMSNSLKVKNAGDIYMLLQCSDFVQHDLKKAFVDCSDRSTNATEYKKYLVLRKWKEINPSHEFRCFVKNGKLVSVSQRDVTKFHDYIAQNKDSILRDIKTFFNEHLADKFPSPSYAFDIVRPSKDSVLLLDFNPYGVTTDPLLFEWDVETGDIDFKEEEGEIEFRFVQHNAGIQPDGFRRYGVPVDIVDLMDGSDPEKLIDFLKLQKRREEISEANERLEADGELSD